MVRTYSELLKHVQGRDRPARESNGSAFCLPGGDVHLGFDEIRVDAEHGCAECLEKHPKMPCRAKFQRKGSSTALL
jgi:hypothetical protein